MSQVEFGTDSNTRQIKEDLRALHTTVAKLSNNPVGVQSTDDLSQIIWSYIGGRGLYCY